MLASAIDLMQWAIREKIDHIHGHTCADGAHVLALARRMGGPPYSLTLHGDLAVYGRDHRSKMQGAAFVSAVGNHLRRQILEQVGLPEDRVSVTCMGVETAELATLGRSRVFTPGSLKVLTVARLHQAKGHVHALGAIHRGIKAGLDLHYTIVGEGPYRDAIAMRTAELGLEDRVTMTGTLSEAEIYQLLSEADAFVLPSTGMGEAWPVSIMEAMAAALPVIATVIGATPDMIKPGHDGFLVPQADEDALLEKLTIVANDADIRRRVGENARKTAAIRFDVAMTARFLLDAIRANRGVSDGVLSNRTEHVSAAHTAA